MKIQWKALLINIVIPLAVGAISGFVTSNTEQIFEQLNKPPLSPPAILFPIVWSILYLFMGISSYIVYTSNFDIKQKQNAIKLNAAQLVVNFFWSIIFFGLSLYFVGFIWVLLLIVLVVLLIKTVKPISKYSAFFLYPYLAWICFAAYLSLAIAIIN